MQRLWIAGLAASLLSVLSLSGSPVRADEPQGWGTVKGQVVFGGDVPAPELINVNKDQQHCLEKGPLTKETWVINKENKGVRYTFVWLAPEPGTTTPLPINPKLKDPKEKSVTIDQPCCAFVPHCLGMREGQELIVKNSAPVAHNVNYTGNPRKNPGGNFLLPPNTKKVIDNLKADRFPLQVTCNIHPWMNARVAVFDHPYFAVTDENGNFEIKDAPAGTYRLKVWHEAIGWRGGAAGRDGEKITIKPEAVTDLGKLEVKP
jgi:hypothetical protein